MSLTPPPEPQPQPDPHAEPDSEPAPDEGPDGGHHDSVPAAGPLPESEWLRMDRRMLVIGPLLTLGQFLFPLLLGLIGLGTQFGPITLVLIPVAALGALALAALQWWTTFYRRTPTHMEVRRGLLNRTTQTVRLDRIRSVDLTSPLLFRILDLTKTEIGTGVDDTRIELQGLRRAAASRLRADLLDRSGEASAPTAPTSSETAVRSDEGGPDGEARDAPPAPSSTASLPEPTVLAALDWGWLRYAPLSLARMAIVAGALGAASQFLDDLPIWSTDTARDTWAWIAAQALAPVLIVAAIVLAVAWVILSVVGYTLQWYGFKLVRAYSGRTYEVTDDAGTRTLDESSLHLTHGLLTTRSVTVEERRVRGVHLVEPALMRLADGAELTTMTTGVDNGTQKVLPSCPTRVAVAVGHDVLGGDAPAARPLTAPLVAHGRAARVRRHVRWQWITVVVGAALAAGWWFWVIPWQAIAGAVPALLVLCVAGAELAYRNLGHTLVGRDGEPTHVVVGSGSFARERTVLETDGVIGWVVQRSLFQRRVGLATLVATTAAGSESVDILDMPWRDVPGFIRAATPRPVEPFLS